MDTQLSFSEKKAQDAEKLPAFLSIKLLHIRAEVGEMLGTIGKTGFFANYTKHDISHIDAMLHILDWLIPSETKSLMTPAEWLQTVLAIYFHDLGLFVSNDEYSRRSESDFGDFKERVLFVEDAGIDYKDRLAGLSKEDQERFLYEEFVRANHGVRVKSWIENKPDKRLGVSDLVASEVDRLLKDVDRKFRKDLALICESHHLDDLNDTTKYNTSTPYGSTDAECANTQYVAILLRSADLLHITRDRTPSLSYRLLNPSDPMSQREWAKQMAVKRIRPQIARNESGESDPSIQQDTLEVFAHFEREEGYFGLNSYLRFAADQLRKSNVWATESQKKLGVNHSFPWRRLDDSHVETEGFIKENFRFTFDQAKILDLLTGHTLYNDTSVVVRELVQNSIDAIRLQSVIDKDSGDGLREGEIVVRWDSANRNLTVQDNGTGMTQAIIEGHLLKVGSSRYSSTDFKKQYPEFSAISRFGIGILSAFMISDDVEILTCHPLEEEARQLALKSVHGNYLVRLINKQALDPELAPHGTRIRLRIRASAAIGDVQKILESWVVVPRCRVDYIEDDEAPRSIGFNSTKEAVLDYLRKQGWNVQNGEVSDAVQKIEVRESVSEGVSLAYAVIWSEYFQEWSFMTVPQVSSGSPVRGVLGTCVEGIRVETSTPGFSGQGVIAIANVYGPSAPKTNVARSGLEVTPELGRMLKLIYGRYCDHVRGEITELWEARGFSLTWAVREANFLAYPLHKLETPNGWVEALSDDELNAVLRTVPTLVVERAGKREAAAVANLASEAILWTADSVLLRSAEELLREVSGTASLADVLSVVGKGTTPLPSGTLVSNGYRLLDQSSEADREITGIKVMRKERRVDMEWSRKATKARWITLNGDALRYMRNPGGLSVGLEPVSIEGIEGEVAIASLGTLFLLPETELARVVGPILLRANEDGSRYAYPHFLATLLEFIRHSLASTQFVHAGDVEKHMRVTEVPSFFDITRFAAAMSTPAPRLFDVGAWSRHSMY